MTTPCNVVPFPAVRQVGKIRTVADGLARRVGERRGGEGYWRQCVDNMARRMQAAGLTEDVIDRELRAFREAVSIELGRLHDAGARRSL